MTRLGTTRTAEDRFQKPGASPQGDDVTSDSPLFEMRCYTEHSTLSVQGMFLPLALDDTARPAVPAVNILGTNDTWT